MNKYLYNLKYIVLGALVSLTSCVNDDLPNVGDLIDTSGPTPFYNYTDLTTSEFDCSDNELWAKYEFNFQAGSNLAVNGIYYEWSVKNSQGEELINNGVAGEQVTLVNKDLPILEQLIEAERATVVAIEDAIAKIEFKIPCEDDADKVAVLEDEVDALELKLAAAKDELSDEVLENITELENKISTLEAATINNRELIFAFPEPGEYTVGLTVTDNLGKSDSVEKLITVNQAIPTIAVPEIGEPGFEDLSLFDGTGDGRDSWRAPSNNDWSPVGGGTTIFQINTKSEGVLPEGTQAAKFPAGGERIAYQEIDVTPGATYVLTYFTGFNMDNYGDITVSILNPSTSNVEEAKLEANIIATRTDNNVGRVKDVFKKHAITFEAGEHETVIIFATNYRDGGGDEARLDAFDIIVKQ